jgi:hypothetical protein
MMEPSEFPTTKTARMLMSFQSVELLPEHRNYGDQYLALRDYGVAPSVATALIRWGEQHDLVCTFVDSQGRGRNAYSWQPSFLVAAVRKHIELFGELAKKDLPTALYERGTEE